MLWKSLRITEKHGAEGKPCGNNIFRAGNPRDFLVNNHFQVVDQFGQMDIVGILGARNDGFDLKIKNKLINVVFEKENICLIFFLPE